MPDLLSSERVIKIAMRGCKDIITVNWHGEMIQVRYLLSPADETSLIHAIVDCCYDEKNDRFIIDLLDMSIRSNIVSAYALIELPNDFTQRHAVLYRSDLFDVVKKNANSYQVDNIVNIATRYVLG